MSEPLRVQVKLEHQPYEVLIGNDLLSQVGEFAKKGIGRKKGAVVTDSTVGPLYAEKVMHSLREAGMEVILVTVPAGEASKSMAVVEQVCREMLQAGLDRKAFLVALGGGVIGDLAGFAASIFMRGIPFIQIPTTVLSQVDSSVGGKTGVNTPEGKNLIGTFSQPSLVLADVDCLKSLPARAYHEGFAEIIKHAAIRDESLFTVIREVAEGRGDLAKLIQSNVQIKASVIEADEFETLGVRALLNFGHTIGHAIEAAAGYGELLHGEAISIGMMAAAKLSEKFAGLDPQVTETLKELFELYHLPTQLGEGISDETLLNYMKHDKKFSEGAIRFVLLNRAGSAIVSKEITQNDLVWAIHQIRA